MTELLSHLPSLGVVGLLFVMWWYERLERLRGRDGLQDAVRDAGRTAGVNDRLIEVLRANTEALSGLREELRAQRMLQAEWISRLCERLDRLDAA